MAEDINPLERTRLRDNKSGLRGLLNRQIVIDALLSQIGWVIKLTRVAWFGRGFQITVEFHKISPAAIRFEQADHPYMLAIGGWVGRLQSIASLLTVIIRYILDLPADLNRF